MAVKTITIDMEAYTLLARHKHEGQSFSDVIKAHFGPQPTAAALRARLGKIRVSDEALDHVEQQARSRRREPARAVAR